MGSCFVFPVNYYYILFFSPSYYMLVLEGNKETDYFPMYQKYLKKSAPMILNTVVVYMPISTP